MEEQLIVDRARLRELLHTKPDWTQEAYAAELKRSEDWVRKWSKRLCEAEGSCFWQEEKGSPDSFVKGMEKGEEDNRQT